MVQENSKSLQEGGVKPLHIAIAAGLLALCFVVTFYPKIVLWLLVAGVAAWAAWSAAEKKREAREAAARAAAYANICGPVVIPSMHPGETVTEVQIRADEFKEQMRIGGNPYWLQVPVIPMPYQPMLYGVGQLTAAWNIYLREVGERQHVENLKWAEHCPAQLKPIFLSQVMPQPAQTTEV